MAKFLDLEGLNYFWEKIKSWVLERFASKSDLYQKLNTLISGQNIKTINNESVLGSGNIEIQGGGDVNSVNGKTGDVVLNAEDVGALPDSTIIPTKVSDLTNDSSFSSVSIDRKVSTGTNIADITIDGTTTLLYAPTSGGGGGEENIIEVVKVNGTALTPDANKAVNVEVPTKTSDLQNDSGFITGFTETDPTVPSWAKQSNKPSYNYSEIGNTPDLSGFITNSVNNLTNYYLKSETYTKDEVEALIGAIQNFHYEIYDTLPQSGVSNVLYLIGPTGSGADKYEEYVWKKGGKGGGSFVKIGDTSIDLSGYVTTSALNTTLAGYATTQDLDDSKVFWVEVDVTTFDEIKDAIDAGRTVMLKDDDGYIYVLLYTDVGCATFSCTSGEESFIKTYNVSEEDSWELSSIYDIETKQNLVQSISSSNSGSQYPSAKAVWDIVSTKYTKPQGGIPASDLASGVIPTVPVQDVTVGGTSVVNNGTAVIPQEVFVATYGTTTIAEIDAAVSGNKSVVCFYQGYQYVLSFKATDDSYYFACHLTSANYWLKILGSNDTWSKGTTVMEVNGNKVSTISGNETNTTKYPNTKAVYNAIHPAIATTEPSGGMLPNVLYEFGELSGNTTFTFATPSDNTIANHYYFTFDTPSTAPTITWPTGLTWFGGSAPTISASKHYEISVLNGIAIAMEV